MPVCLCCGEDVDAAQDYHPLLPFLQSLYVGDLSQVSELGSRKEVSVGPDIQSHRAPTRAADEMRRGLRRPAYRSQYAGALHHMPKRPAPSDVDRRMNSKVKHGRPAGPLMKCGYGCGTRLTASQMRTHFTGMLGAAESLTAARWPASSKAVRGTARPRSGQRVDTGKGHFCPKPLPDL
jgi:hypothetical protein